MAFRRSLAQKRLHGLQKMASSAKETRIRNPVGKARYMVQIGISISSSIICPSDLNKVTASVPAMRKMIRGDECNDTGDQAQDLSVSFVQERWHEIHLNMITRPEEGAKQWKYQPRHQSGWQLDQPIIAGA